MGRGRSGRTANMQLQPIRVDARWYFHPDNADFKVDLDDLAKNPIPFVGIGPDRKIGELIDGYGTVQDEYRYDVEVNISSLQTLQPFVLRSGMTGDVVDEGAPYVVLLDGKYYLVDGNHRVARAKVAGQKTVRADVSVLKRI